jgi:hypothetical protein
MILDVGDGLGMILYQIKCLNRKVRGGVAGRVHSHPLNQYKEIQDPSRDARCAIIFVIRRIVVVAVQVLILVD